MKVLWGFASLTLANDCYDLARNGTGDFSYEGDVDQTWSGKKCQSWSAKAPHEPSKAVKNKVRSLNIVGSACRNPDNDPNGPWCYTTDENTRWEYCKIDSCEPPIPENTPDKTCLTDNGTKYRGRRNVDNEGRPCQAWTALYPHRSNYLNTTDDAAANFCRNPNNDPLGPWCYIAIPDLLHGQAPDNIHHGVKGYCDIRPCPKQAKIEETFGECGNPFFEPDFAEDNQPTNILEMWAKNDGPLLEKSGPGMKSGGKRRKGKRRGRRDLDDQYDDYYADLYKAGPAEGDVIDETFDENVEEKVRIVGGEEAAPHSFPWQIQLKRGKSVQCGGSIVAPNLIITAAHCFDKKEVKKYGKWYRAKGKCTELKQNEMIVAGAHTNYGQEEYVQERPVKKFCIHPKYKKDEDSGLVNDIAIVYVDRFEFTQGVAPVCLPTPNARLPDEIKCVVTGFGVTDDGTTSTTLQQAVMTIRDREQCTTWLREFLNKPEYQTKPTQICAGEKSGGIDACQGDSGGPLVCKHKGQYVLDGIVSQGQGCGKPKAPGIYTKVASRLIYQFIQKHLQLAKNE